MISTLIYLYPQPPSTHEHYKGAKIDTCQLLSLDDVTESFNWLLPNIEILQPGFEFVANQIPWDTLKLNQIDWTNFDLRQVRFDDNWLDTTFTELIGSATSGGVGDLTSALSSSSLSNIDASSVCTFLQQSIAMSENFFNGGGCTCNGDNDGVLSIGCTFNDVCVPQEIEELATTTGRSISSNICGNIDFDLNFDVLAGVDNTVCIDYIPPTADDTTTTAPPLPPQVCFTYTIPFADDSIGPLSCSATYGGDENVCGCSINENFCLQVDCSEFGGSSAVVDSCQFVGLDKAQNAQPFLLKIGGPEEGSLLADDGDVDLTEQGPSSSSDPTSSGLSSGSMDDSAAFIHNTVGFALSMAFIIASPLLVMIIQ